MQYQIIEDQTALKLVCANARKHSVVMLDTEFVRVKTYYPQLGLIQLYDGEQVSLIDTVKIKELTPFIELLTDPDVTKVLHACGEDLETLLKVCGCVPEPMIDTQIMAAFLGHGLSAGFAQLTEHYLSVTLDKSESRTDWLARPLTKKQESYAAADVYYLKPLYEALLSLLTQTHWLTACLDECKQMSVKRQQVINKDKAYLQIKSAWKLSRKQLSLLQPLATWRLEKAQQINIALNFVIKEHELIKIAQLGLNSIDRLYQESIDPYTIRRHGKTLVDIVTQALRKTEAEYPEKIMPINERTGYKKCFARLKDTVKTVAAQSGLPPELIASNKQLNQLLHWVWDEKEMGTLPELMQSWRKELIGELLYRQLVS